MLPPGLAGRLLGGIERLATRRARALLVVVGVLLVLPSVGAHRALDDHVLGLITRGEGEPLGLHRAPLDAFTFTTGSREDNHALMDAGLMLPWWTDPELRIALFRPLSALTHLADERLFPGNAVAMHLHSLAWYAALLAAAALAYSRLEATPRLAGLALFLYALDDAHAPAVAWLANRNALIASTFALLAVVAHDAWRRSGRALPLLGSVAALGAGLLAGELAVGGAAYIAAHAATRDSRRGVARALAALPAVATVAAWRLAWSARGHGAGGSGAYVDPLGDPVAFLLAAPAKLAFLAHGQLSAPPSDLAFLAPPAHVPWLLGLAVATSLLVGRLLLRVLREDAAARFWGLGALLALLPLAATFPSDRLLLLVGVGASPLVARVIDGALGRAALGRPDRGLDGVLSAGLLLLHGAVAPLVAPARAFQMELFGIAHEAAWKDIPLGGGSVVVVSAPTVIFASYLQADRLLAGAPRPRHVALLASASSSLEVTRPAPDVLAIRPREGFLYTPLEQHYRADPRGLEPGARVELSAFTATVREALPDGRPALVEFRLERGAEPTRLVVFRGGRFVPFEPPPPGRSVTLPAEDFGDVLVRALLRRLSEAAPTDPGPSPAVPGRQDSS